MFNLFLYLLNNIQSLVHLRHIPLNTLPLILNTLQARVANLFCCMPVV
jgi:hypothetical protein